VLTLQPLPNVDGVKALRWVLKRMLRHYGLKCTDLHEAAGDHEGPTQK
jgi:hypothetical protein